VKVLVVEEEEEVEDQKCESCGCGDDAGRIMLCDGCDKCYHIYCLPRPLLEVHNTHPHPTLTPIPPPPPS
jgi:hypothetical protein